MQLLIATRNAHKTAEFAKMLAPEFTISDLTSERDFPQVEETGKTFEANATLKAIAASRMVHGLVVADDSGLEVDALGGAPGVNSARYSGPAATDGDNVAKLLAELRRVGARSGAAARFRCALVLACDGSKLAGFDGVVEGTIISSPRGRNGFGYDPAFIPAGLEETFAELSAETKNALSHRGSAIALLRTYLQQRHSGAGT